MIRQKFWISLLLMFVVSAVFAAAPEKLNYQGYLQQKVDGVFKPAVDGDYSVTFKLYDVATGGTALWTSAKTVTVADGIYSTVLGEAVALSGLAFDKPYYLGVTVGSDSEMEPRQTITASAYAVQSKKTEKVGTLTNGKWCNSDGNVINCEQDAPSGGGGFGVIFTGSFTLESYNDDISDDAYAGISSVGDNLRFLAEEYEVASPIAVACSAQNLRVHVTAPVSGNLTVTLRSNGADTALACTVNTGGTTCSDTTNSVSLDAGDLVAMEFDTADTYQGGEARTWSLSCS